MSTSGPPSAPRPLTHLALSGSTSRPEPGSPPTPDPETQHFPAWQERSAEPWGSPPTPSQHAAPERGPCSAAGRPAHIPETTPSTVLLPVACGLRPDPRGLPATACGQRRPAPEGGVGLPTARGHAVTPWETGHVLRRWGPSPEDTGSQPQPSGLTAWTRGIPAPSTWGPGLQDTGHSPEVASPS